MGAPPAASRLQRDTGRRYPGEEDGAVAGESGGGWLVDPIDGTTNYLYGRPDWAISVTAVRSADSRAVAAAVAEPALGRLTEAWCTYPSRFEENQRR